MYFTTDKYSKDIIVSSDAESQIISNKANIQKIDKSSTVDKYSEEIAVSSDAESEIISNEVTKNNIADKFDILEKDSNAKNLFSNSDILNLRNSVIDKLFDDYVGTLGTFSTKEEAVANWFNEDTPVGTSSPRKLFIEEFNLQQNKLNSKYYTKNATIIQNKISLLEKEINSIGELQDNSTSKYADKEFEWFVYSNSVYRNQGEDNKYLMRYEDIQGKNESQQNIFLDNSTSIMNFFTKYRPNGFNSDTDFCGAFIYPNLNHKNVVMTNGGEKDSISIDVSESITVPIVFEYYLDGTANSAITKSLFFDIRNSLISNPLHYMIEITGNYDFTSTGDIYNNFSGVELSDSVTN